MENTGIVYGYRKKKKPDDHGKFFVFQFEGADLSNEEWRDDVSTQIYFETRGLGQGEVVFMWKNPIYD